MIGITIATVAVVVFYNSSMSVNNLVFQFYFNDAGKASLAMIASYLPLVAFMPFASRIVVKTGKKKLLTLSGLVSAMAGVIMLFLPITPDLKGVVIYVAGLMIVNIGCCVFQIIVWAMVADCIEDSYRKKGVREEASLYALYSFFQKTGARRWLGACGTVAEFCRLYRKRSSADGGSICEHKEPLHRSFDRWACCNDSFDEICL